MSKVSSIKKENELLQDEFDDEILGKNFLYVSATVRALSRISVAITYLDFATALIARKQ